MLRRLLDILISALGLITLSPVMAVAAVLLKWQSPGPVFFRSPRVGLDGQTFRIWKFRTMVVGADKGSAITGKDDPRITTIGRFLRKSKVDEIPQLINVLVGEMSLVGPRPETLSVAVHYAPVERQVLSVRPGITGPSQIRWRSEEEMYPPGVDHEAYYLAEILPRKLHCDLEYVTTRSLLRDIGYLFLTVATVFGLCRTLKPIENAMSEVAKCHQIENDEAGRSK